MCFASGANEGNDTVQVDYEQAHLKPTHLSPKFINVTFQVINDDISVVTLKRTDTTLDLSQMAKRFGFQNKETRECAVFIVLKGSVV